MRTLSRLLLLAGSAGIVLSALLPWVTIKGLPLKLDLGVIGADVSPLSKTVNGTETSLWPYLVAAGLVIGALTLLDVAPKLLLAAGVLVTLAGAALLFYVLDVVDLETSGSGPVARAIARAVVDSSAGPGPPLLLASGLAIVAGALARA